ncbi:LOB domain-containing protein 41 [Rhynchospora pubera]|uniref:LOB domain-containing protein 41 n=1 Tax=Rhynchospora pubera TaxID=906938 RepID=A0AAV8GYW4_9POAL|nr:LOB domain-containing protein 41 [Rhynchospora pubera]
MRMSCNGCRVLRKACPDDCVIRPCLGWIRTAEAQGNATLFLAKFYGRAGLTNLLAARPQNQRAAIFRSLLYEACGRIVNPIYGSVGLLWSEQWHLCQAAVESVLKGTPISQIATATASTTTAVTPIKASDIRHIANRKSQCTIDLHKVNASSRVQFKHTGFWSICPETDMPGSVEEENQRAQESREIANGSHVSLNEHVCRKQELDSTEEDSGLDLTLGNKSKSRDELCSYNKSDDHEMFRSVELQLTIRHEYSA